MGIVANKEISILMQNKDAYESVEEKNRFIRHSDTEWIGFVDGEVADEEEVCSILEENPFLMDYDAILFGDHVPEGECSHLDMLAHPKCLVFTLFFRKSLLVNTGSYHRLLPGNVNYEFVLRLAEKGRLYVVPCSAGKEVAFHPLTMAYILRRYMESLKEHDILEQIFLGFVQAAKAAGQMAEFQNNMNLLLEDSVMYERLVADTAPCMIMVSDDIAYYGVVDGFANRLADALVGMGQAVITTNDKYGNYSNVPADVLLNRIYKAVIGFQAPALQADTFRNLKGKKYQFWLDDPMFFGEFFRNTPKETNILCQDSNYAEYLRKHFQLENAKQFPPAGVEINNTYQERIYDLVFIGRYIILPKADYDTPFKQSFYQYMIQHPRATVEQGIRYLWNEQGIPYDEALFMQKVEEMKPVCHDLLQMYRHRIVEAILEGGISLHVFGDSWKEYRGRGEENLIIHPKVMVEESLQIWSQAKIGLNIMNGHKAGMTERIANIMLCGACCVSDETGYLNQHFFDGEDIVLYQADALDELVGKIQYLLQHDDVREEIAQAGQKKAKREHTWIKRAEDLMEMINEK